MEKIFNTNKIISGLIRSAFKVADWLSMNHCVV